VTRGQRFTSGLIDIAAGLVAVATLGRKSSELPWFYASYIASQEAMKAGHFDQPMSASTQAIGFSPQA
jgi:hypothetical protein